MKIFDPENLADYVWMWDKRKYQFMDEPTIYTSIVDLMNYLKAEGYTDFDVNNMKVELAKNVDNIKEV